MKNFKEEFYKIHSLLKNNTPFCFIRFSDGELFMLKNEEVKLAENNYVTGNISGVGRYTEEEQKHFLPERDSFYRDELIRSLKHTQPNYIKGICSRTDVGEEGFNFQLSFLNDKSENDLTFANLFINSNYELFITEILSGILKFTNRPIAMVLNENCKIENLSPFFTPQKIFKIGSNCLVNNYSTIEEVRQFLDGKEDWIVLLSAATLSNLIGYYGFSSNNRNTFIDIGSTLNPILGLEGWVYSRDYLRHYWLNQKSHYCLREEKW